MDFMMIMLTMRDATPSAGVMAEMGAYAGKLAKQGKLKGGQPLKPEAEGVRIRAEGDSPVVSDGPFLESKEVVGGYFVIECDSHKEAIEIAKQCPHMLSGLGPVELRELIHMGPPPS